MTFEEYFEEKVMSRWHFDGGMKKVFKEEADRIWLASREEVEKEIVNQARDIYDEAIMELNKDKLKLKEEIARLKAEIERLKGNNK